MLQGQSQRQMSDHPLSDHGSHFVGARPLLPHRKGSQLQTAAPCSCLQAVELQAGGRVGVLSDPGWGKGGSRGGLETSPRQRGKVGGQGGHLGT